MHRHERRRNESAGLRSRSGQDPGKANLGDVKIGVVSGDDLLPRIEELRREVPFTNLDTGQPLSTLDKPIVAANAYLGARGIVEALAGGARIVITGRVADASLTVGPAIHEYGWRWDDWDRLAAASVAGHLIECGAQATGGLSFDWAGLDLANVGYPIIETERQWNIRAHQTPGHKRRGHNRNGRGAIGVRDRRTRGRT